MACPRRQDVQTFLLGGGSTSSPALRHGSGEFIITHSPVRALLCDDDALAHPSFILGADGHDLQLKAWQQHLSIPLRHEQAFWHRHANMAIEEGSLLNVAPPLDGAIPTPTQLVVLKGQVYGLTTARAIAAKGDVAPAPTHKEKRQKQMALKESLYDAYLEPSHALLAKGRLLHMGTLRPGLFQGKVGLLSGMHGEFMQKYEKAPKTRRAPREDLSIYTAEEKVERRKARARAYSNIARQRQEASENEFKFDLGFMRSFRIIMEEGPNMVAVLAPDLEAHVLYANEAFDRVVSMPTKLVLGKTLWMLIHEADHSAFRHALVSVVLTKKPPSEHVPCRLARKKPDGYLDVQVSLSMGTQGLLCVFWVA